MKRKLLLYLPALFLFTVPSAEFATLYIVKSAAALGRLVTHHSMVLEY